MNLGSQGCVCAVSRTDLQPWQILKLDSAFETGRRHVKASCPLSVACASYCTCPLNRYPAATDDHACDGSQISQLSHELQLDRQDVLQWLKDHAARSETCASPCSHPALGPRPAFSCRFARASCCAVYPRDSAVSIVFALWHAVRFRCVSCRARDNMRQVAAAAATAAEERKAVLRSAREGGRLSDGAPSEDVRPARSAQSEASPAASAATSSFASEPCRDNAPYGMQRRHLNRQCGSAFAA